MESDNTHNTYAFINKYQNDLIKDFQLDHCKCQIFQTSENDLQKACQKIKQGELVSFPTETVYGLGANALDPNAVEKIYKTKRRPFTDPVIVHVTSMEAAKQLTQIDQKTLVLFEKLAQKFWPGPLTFILRANFDKISRIITAQTDFVGIRFPSNKIAQQLIDYSGCPIAAPSANIFGHISPTSPIHVFNDFYNQNISIINGENSEFGVESTILRYGSISVQQLKQHIQNYEELKEVIVYGKNEVLPIDESAMDDKSKIGQEAPGQLLKHYSPLLESFLFDVQELPNPINNDKIQLYEKINLQNTIILDFAKQSQFLHKECLKYCELSEQNNLQEVMKILYSQLRWAENVENAKYILVYNIQKYYDKIGQLNTEFLETVFDKIFRCTEGKSLIFDSKTNQFYQIQE